MRLVDHISEFLTGVVPDRCPVMGRIHDYPMNNGGYGDPWHFYIYTCSFCGQEFGI